MKGVALEWELHEFNPTIMPLFFAIFFLTYMYVAKYY